GGGVKLGIPITDYISTTVRYSGYSQKIQLPSQYMNCNNINRDGINTFPTPDQQNNPAIGGPFATNSYADGEAPLAVKRELAQGAVFVSLIGYGLTYNTLDNTRNPTSGLLVSLSQDFAGVGGDVNFIKTTADMKLYSEVLPDIVGLLRFQAGHATGWGGQGLRMLRPLHRGPPTLGGSPPARPG